jgi:hypothetical protein
MFKDMVQRIYFQAYKLEFFMVHHLILMLIYSFFFINSNLYKTTTINKNYNNLEANIFKGIDLSYIVLLNKRIRLLLKKYVINNNISPEAIIHKNLTKSFLKKKKKTQNIAWMLEKSNDSLDSYLFNSCNDIDNEQIEIHDIVYTKQELLNLIKNHNKNLNMPGLGELSPEKEVLIE